MFCLHWHPPNDTLLDLTQLQVMKTEAVASEPKDLEEVISHRPWDRELSRDGGLREFWSPVDATGAQKEKKKATALDEVSVAGALLQISISNVTNCICLSTCIHRPSASVGQNHLIDTLDVNIWSSNGGRECWMLSQDFWGELESRSCPNIYFTHDFHLSGLTPLSKKIRIWPWVS